MTTLRIPTTAQNDAMVSANRARHYLDVQALRGDVIAAGVACCDVAANEPDDDGMGWASLIAATFAGLGMWAAVGYATWWVVGFFFGAHA